MTILGHRPAAALLSAALCLPALAACGDGDKDTDTAARDSTGTPPSSEPADATDGGLSGELIVLAAASLTETYTELGDAFEAEYPGLDVRFSFAGSTTLAQQLLSGAPGDVYASANETQMGRLSDAGLTAGAPTTFVKNLLEIAVPPDNPGQVEGLTDFHREELDIAVCAEQVPCGSTTQEVFDVAGIEASVDTFEQDVKAVLTKVELGEVDAGMVYRTDVAAAGEDVTGIEFPAARNAVNTYPIAVLDEAENPDAAEAFVEFILSEQAADVFSEAGFVLPREDGGAATGEES